MYLYELESAHCDNNVVFLLALLVGDYASCDFLAVNSHALNALLNVGRILYFDVVDTFTELSCYLEVTEILRSAGINLKSFVCRIYTEDEMLTKVHAAVPVSHEFLPSPWNLASAPPTIWQ